MPFTKPPLDGTLTFPELFDFHWFHNPEHPLFKYERYVDGMTGEVEVEVVTWSRAVRAIHSAAAYVERACMDEYGGSGVPAGGVVAILANIDTFSYYVLIGGVMRAGFVPFPISPRNTPSAIFHLLHSTGTRHILSSSDPGVQRLTEAVVHASNVHHGHHGPSSQGASVPSSPLNPVPSPWLMSSGASPLTPASAVSFSGQPWLSPGGEPLQFFPVPTFEYLFHGFDDTFEPSRPVPHAPSDRVAVIGHSSGTMGLPKANHLTTAFMLAQARNLHQDDDFSTSVWSCHSVPMSHTMGVCIMAWSLISPPQSVPSKVFSGYTIASFPPDTVHIVPNPERILASACASGSDTMICLPSCLETGSRSPHWVEKLKTFKQVLYAGAPLYTETGDYLTSQGVKLRPIYGATECGIVLDIRAQHNGDLDDWEYFQFSTHLQTEFRPFHDDVFELLISSEILKRCSPSVLTSEYNGQMMYNTLDLIQRHPTKPNWWKVYGRSDEQLTHSTVERTNPAPIELRLRKHPKIANAIVFGHGRVLPGVIIEIAEGIQVNASNHADREKLRNQIWFYMDQINDFLPVHSRIVKEMMLLADPSKPLSVNVNAKGLIRRTQALAAYESEIEEAYATVHLSTPVNLPVRDAWELDECLVLVRKVVRDVLSGSCTNWPGDFGHERSSPGSESRGGFTDADTLDDDTDLISTVGLNSIQVIYIQQTILSALHHGAKISCRRIPSNFVYTNPTIRSLGEFMMKIIVQGHGLVGGSLVGKRVADMEEYVKRYTVHAEKRAPKCRRRGRRRAAGEIGAQGVEAGEVVMLTGSTGAIGAHILEELVKNPRVVRVYAVNRPDRRRRCRISTATSLDDVEWSKPRTSGERHEDVFQTFGLDALILLDEKVKFVEADLDAEHFDLDQDLYTRLHGEVTCIIHAAWPSNPNIHLASLEPMLAGTRNLLDFALGSPLRSAPRFIFLSTLHIFSNWVGGPRSPESANTRPGSALGQGYSESKWIAERIIDHAAQKHSPVLLCTIVRLGHICASRNGMWGKKHCMTALAKSVLEVGCMPRPQGDITWLPMHHAAAAVVEIALPRTPSSTYSTLRYLNLTHPRPVSADLLFSSLSRHMGGCEVVSYEEWLAALRNASCLAPSSTDVSASSSQSCSSPQSSSALVGSIGYPLDTFIQRLRSNPAGLHLLDFFRSVYKPVKPYSKDTEAFGFPLADNEKAIEAAPNTLGSLREMDVEREVVAWVKGWKGSGSF